MKQRRNDSSSEEDEPSQDEVTESETEEMGEEELEEDEEQSASGAEEEDDGKTVPPPKKLQVKQAPTSPIAGPSGGDESDEAADSEPLQPSKLPEPAIVMFNASLGGGVKKIRLKSLTLEDKMITALRQLDDRSGCSLVAIKKHIVMHWPDTNMEEKRMHLSLKRYIKKAVEAGDVVQTRGKGAAGSFRLSKDRLEMKNRKKPTTTMKATTTMGKDKEKKMPSAKPKPAPKVAGEKKLTKKPTKAASADKKDEKEPAKSAAAKKKSAPKAAAKEKTTAPKEKSTARTTPPTASSVSKTQAKPDNAKRKLGRKVDENENVVKPKAKRRSTAPVTKNVARRSIVFPQGRNRRKNAHESSPLTSTPIGDVAKSSAAVKKTRKAAVEKPKVITPTVPVAAMPIKSARRGKKD